MDEKSAETILSNALIIASNLQEGYYKTEKDLRDAAQLFSEIILPGYNEAMSSESMRAVSYTHLTLPTIYSV